MRMARPRTAVSTLTGLGLDRIICAISESRGVSPTVGMAFINLETCHGILCQVCDTQTYVRTVQKLYVMEPSEILIASTATDPKSKLLSIIEECSDELQCSVTLTDRRYWNEATGLQLIRHLTLEEDLDALLPLSSNSYFSTACLAAVLKHVEHSFQRTFPPLSLRLKYEPSEGSMMMDVNTIRSLEIIQNSQDTKSKYCLYGLMNETLTPMGARLLRSNLLQPLTDQETLSSRYDAVDELISNQGSFHGIREALKHSIDMDKLLTALVVIPAGTSPFVTENSINNIIMLKTFLDTIPVVTDTLRNLKSQLLVSIRQLCHKSATQPVQDLIKHVLNDDVKFSKSALDLRNQRAFAVNAGHNGLLDISRQTYKENYEDAYSHVQELESTLSMKLDLKYDSVRQFYIRFNGGNLDIRQLPQAFVHLTRRKQIYECSTLTLMKINQKTTDSHNKCIELSDAVIQTLLQKLPAKLPAFFKISEGYAMLDMLCAFTQLAISGPTEYVRPQLSKTLAVKCGRHPIKERFQGISFVPNDIYSSAQSRFQLVTGCNMSGKSTYIKMVPLLCIMAQIGCFVPAEYASMPLYHQLFAAVSIDDNIEAGASTFAREMRDAAFVLHNLDDQGLVIFDELGRGSSITDGQAIAISIAEHLVRTRVSTCELCCRPLQLIYTPASVWFATHFSILGYILQDQPGVIALHLSCDPLDGLQVVSARDTVPPTFRVESGCVPEAHYGIAIAHSLPFPPSLLERSRDIAIQLTSKREQKRQSASLRVVQLKKRLILSLREQLEQAQASKADESVLCMWMNQLQEEFVRRMDALDFDSESGGTPASETTTTRSNSETATFATMGLPADASDSEILNDAETLGVTNGTPFPPTPFNMRPIAEELLQTPSSISFG